MNHVFFFFVLLYFAASLALRNPYPGLCNPPPPLPAHVGKTKHFLALPARVGLGVWRALVGIVFFGLKATTRGRRLLFSVSRVKEKARGGEA